MVGSLAQTSCWRLTSGGPSGCWRETADRSSQTGCHHNAASAGTSEWTLSPRKPRPPIKRIPSCTHRRPAPRRSKARELPYHPGMAGQVVPAPDGTARALACTRPRGNGRPPSTSTSSGPHTGPAPGGDPPIGELWALQIVGPADRSPAVVLGREVLKVALSGTFHMQITHNHAGYKTKRIP